MQDDIVTENLVLVDWVSITSKIHESPGDWAREIAMQRVPWSSRKGFHGYLKGDYFEGVSIMYHTDSEYRTWLEMSGAGCRAFETYGSGNFDHLFSLVRNHPEEMNLTRLDIAFDDHTGILDIDRICDDVLKQNYVSRSREWECIFSSKGKSCVIGSPTSEIKIRIYDKAAERGFKDGRHWVRVEMQLRDERALAFASKPLDISLSERFLSVLLNYLRFVEPNGDSNRSRWPMASYWEDLCESIEAVRIFSKPGQVYNLENPVRFLSKQGVNAMRTVAKCLGRDAVLKIMDESKTPFSDRHQRIVDAYLIGKGQKRPVRRRWLTGHRYTAKRVDVSRPMYCTCCDSRKPFGDFTFKQGDSGICRACFRLGRRPKEST